MSRSILLALACLLPASLAAQAPEPTVGTLKLSDTERAELLSRNTETSVDDARAGLGGAGPSRQVHGEVGAAIGSHGLHSTYGAAAIPLGNSAGASFSFESDRIGAHR